MLSCQLADQLGVGPHARAMKRRGQQLALAAVRFTPIRISRIAPRSGASVLG